jgi:hypothetical protein
VFSLPMPVAPAMLGMNAIRPDKRPQLSMMRAIHLRAPKRSSSRFEGTSNRK